MEDWYSANSRVGGLNGGIGTGQANYEPWYDPAFCALESIYQQRVPNVRAAVLGFDEDKYERGSDLC
ncbi:MAG: hypothetical protein OXH31_01715 [Gammaproteobacteria bacterium]|nr:hypothetical protein [Gammaproteobacteria bacterium]